MSRFVTNSTLLFLCVVTLLPVQQSGAITPKPVSAEFRPGPEMQKLFNAFVGNWQVRETFEVSASQQGKTRQGSASFRPGPGFSLIEDYNSDGAAGPLKFLALIWWDQQDNVYRFLTCANNDGCAVRGTSKWESNALVNSWQQETNGRLASFRDSFQEISPAGFRLVSEGTAGGKTIWRVITKYDRIPETHK